MTSPHHHRLSLRALFLGASLTVTGLADATPAVEKPAVPASNAQLASPDIERRVDALLARMTLPEKIGQLVQYGATGAS